MVPIAFTFLKTLNPIYYVIFVVVQRIEVTRCHLVAALRRATPSSQRGSTSVHLDTPTIIYEDIAGLEAVKQQLQEVN